jgi:uncharacterized coiled-coil protein SlyX
MKTPIINPPNEVTIDKLQTRVAEQDTRIAELEALVKFYEEQILLSKARQFALPVKRSKALTS